METNPYDPPEAAPTHKSDSNLRPYFAWTPYETAGVAFMAGFVVCLLAGGSHYTMPFGRKLLPHFVTAFHTAADGWLGVILVSLPAALLMAVVHAVVFRLVVGPRKRTLVNALFMVLSGVGGGLGTLLLFNG